MAGNDFNLQNAKINVSDISYESLNMSESNTHLPKQNNLKFKNKLKALNKLPKHPSSKT